MGTRYRIYIGTSSDQGAGTDGTVSIILKGRDGATSPIALNGQFDRGMCENFTVEVPKNVGKISEIELIVMVKNGWEETYTGPAWEPSLVAISGPDDVDVALPLFPPGGLLDAVLAAMPPDAVARMREMRDRFSWFLDLGFIDDFRLSGLLINDQPDPVARWLHETFGVNSPRFATRTFRVTLPPPLIRRPSSSE